MFHTLCVCASSLLEVFHEYFKYSITNVTNTKLNIYLTVPCIFKTLLEHHEVSTSNIVKIYHIAYNKFNKNIQIAFLHGRSMLVQNHDIAQEPNSDTTHCLCAFAVLSTLRTLNQFNLWALVRLKDWQKNMFCYFCRMNVLSIVFVLTVLALRQFTCNLSGKGRFCPVLYNHITLTQFCIFWWQLT